MHSSVETIPRKRIKTDTEFPPFDDLGIDLNNLFHVEKNSWHTCRS